MLCPFFVLCQVHEKAGEEWIYRPLTKAELKKNGIRFRKEQEGDDDDDDDDDDDNDDDDDEEEDSDDFDDDDDEAD